MHYKYNRTFKQAVEYANEKGWRVVVPKPDELFIDIDNAQQYKQFNDNKKLLERWGYKFAVIKDSPSKSGGSRRHIIIKLLEGNDLKLDAVGKIIFQLFLGSDPLRELMSWDRCIHNDICPTIFFEKD